MTDSELLAPYDALDAVRHDGGLVHLRSATQDDLDGLRALHARSSDRSLYLRFFSLNREAADRYLQSLIVPSSRSRRTLVACVRGEIVGVAGYDVVTRTTAEFAVLVADGYHHEGIGTLLLEHLASVARRAGIERFTADVLNENGDMLHVLRDLGFHATSQLDHGTVRVGFELSATHELTSAIDERDRAADAASLRPMLWPGSIAVVGASTRAGSVGHQVLKSIRDGGYTGELYAVNPKHDSVLGVASVASAADLPIAVDLAVIAVPAARVPEVVRGCGLRGVRAVVLLTAGFGEVGVRGESLQDEILAIARDYSIRIIGPNCVGLLNTDPAMSLDATFAHLPIQPGVLGLASQSGAFGIAFVLAAIECELGVAQFVSMGNKADVSGNDLLLAWEDDPHVTVIALYLESIRDARRFVRIARRVVGKKPVLAIKSGRSEAGQRAGQSHTAAAASSEVAVDAIFAEAGVIRLATMQDMLDSARVLASQPLPGGNRVAIIGNSGGPGILAADAAAVAGLEVVALGPATRERLAGVVAGAASTQNPVDLGATVQPDEVAAAVQTLLADDGIDAVLTVFTDVAVTELADVMSAVVAAATTSGKTLVATQAGGAERSMPVPGSTRSVPVFRFPEAAAAALGVAYRYAQIKSSARPLLARPKGIERAAARCLVETALARHAGWLTPEVVQQLLTYYGVPVSPQRIVAGADEAARAAAEVGYPVVLKVVGGSLHKTDVGGVRLGLADEAQLRDAVVDMRSVVPGPSPFMVQPMAGAGTELIVGAVRDPQFGPMVMVGAGGVLVDVVDDRAFRLAPLTAERAEEMIAGLRVSRLLDGYRGRPVVSRSAVRDVLLRVATLVDDVPEIAELDLNPVICGVGGAVVVDARIRVTAPPIAHDPLRRALSGSPPRSSTSPRTTMASLPER